jgi:hypothetical protein
LYYVEKTEDAYERDKDVIAKVAKILRKGDRGLPSKHEYETILVYSFHSNIHITLFILKKNSSVYPGNYKSEILTTVEFQLKIKCKWSSKLNTFY